MLNYLNGCCATLLLLLAFGCGPSENRNASPDSSSAEMAVREGGDPALKAELQERRVAYRDELSRVVDVMNGRYRDGTDNIDGLIKVRIELGEAEMAVTSDPLERIKKLETILEQLRYSESYQEARLRSGAGRTDELHKSKAARIYGEIMLLEERERQQKARAQGL